MRSVIFVCLIFLSILPLFSCVEPANESSPESIEIVVQFLDAVKTDRMETAKTYCHNVYIERHLFSRDTAIFGLTRHDEMSEGICYVDADPGGWTSRRIDVDTIEVKQDYCTFKLQPDSQGEWKIFSHDINFLD